MLPKNSRNASSCSSLPCFSLYSGQIDAVAQVLYTMLSHLDEVCESDVSMLFKDFNIIIPPHLSDKFQDLCFSVFMQLCMQFPVSIGDVYSRTLMGLICADSPSLLPLHHTLQARHPTNSILKIGNNSVGARGPTGVRWMA